jgi:coenzyme F420-reducing hydrogenase alpha subunit
MEDLKEEKQLHWNKTVTKMVNTTSKLADKVETVLNKTADTVFIAADMIGGVASGLSAKVVEKFTEGANKWSALKNKSAEKMVNTHTKMETAKKEFHDKLAAGVEKGNQLVSFVVGVVDGVVGKVGDKIQETKTKVQEHKSEHKARIFFVPLPSKLSTSSARIVAPVQPVSTPVAVPAEIVVKQEITSTMDTSTPQSIYSY